jgi:hypothetical protein
MPIPGGVATKILFVFPVSPFKLHWKLKKLALLM